MSQIITVSNTAELYQALKQAVGGDTIKLAGGNYGPLTLKDSAQLDLSFASKVTITSADPRNPAVITGLDLQGASNLTFDGIKFDYRFAAGDPVFQRPFSVSNSANVEFRNSTFDGARVENGAASEDGYGSGVGLTIQSSTGVTVENSTFFNFHRGMLVMESRDIVVRDNELYSIRSDGMNFVEVQNVLIEGNYLHDFRKAASSSDHVDMIQFWTTGTDSPSTDIIIRNNYLDIGEGDWAQSIFMRNEMVDQGLAGPEMFYQNILIENNVIVNGHSHGITVGETAGLIIRNNSVLHADGNMPDGADGGVEIPRITVSATSTGVLITNNLTGGVNGYTTQGSWTVTDNAIVQDQNPLAPGYYGDVFIASSLQPINGVHAFILLPGSALDVGNIGAGVTQPEAGAGLMLAKFHVNGVVSDGASRVFDARFGLPEGTLYHWDFGDGTSATGPLLLHSFTGGGRFDVVLTVALPDGRTSAATLTLGVDGPDVIKLAPGGGFLAYDYGAPTALPVPAAGSAEGIQLSATGVAATVATTHVVEIARSNEIEIDLSLKADMIGTAGEVFRLHGSFLAKVTSTGDLSFTTYSKTGSPSTVTSTGINLADGAEHDIWIRIEGGKILLTVDDKPAVQVDFTGPLGWTGSHELGFGNPWGSANFVGDVSAFSIRTDVTDYPTVPETVVIIGPTPPPQEGRVLIGGTGDDTHIIEYVSDVVQDAGGIDEVRSQLLSLDLRAQTFDDIENAVLVGTAHLDLTGDNLDNRLTGNAGANVLNGRGGNDTLIGGAGHDAYFANGRDTLVERDGGGIDTVHSSGSIRLSSHIERLVLTGAAAIDGTGNNLDNRLTGNAGANVLNGRGGDDTLVGGAGNDIYFTDGQDILAERDGGGVDTVHSSGSIRLSNHIEHLVLTGAAALDGTGNDLGNRITGNAGRNVLNGRGGDDTLVGGAGNDTYFTDGQDILVERDGGGIDTVHSSGSIRLSNHIEHLVLTGGEAIDGIGNKLNNILIGNSAANTLRGGEGRDTLTGGEGRDMLTGGEGRDKLTGGGGSDRFIFRSGFGSDVVTDFNAVGNNHDILNLRNVNSITSFTDLMSNHTKQVAGGVVIGVGEGDVIMLQGVHISDLDVGDFLF